MKLEGDRERLSADVNRIVERLVWMRNHQAGEPLDIARIGDAEDLEFASRDQPAETTLLHRLLVMVGDRFRLLLGGGLAVVGDEGVQVNEMSKALGYGACDAGDNLTAGAMPNQDHVIKAVVTDRGDDVLDVGVESDLRRDQVGTIAETRERGPVDPHDRGCAGAA